MTILLLSGAIATGKTAVATELGSRLGWRLLRVREALVAVTGADATDRQDLQRRGAEIDQRTRGRWLSDFLDEVKEGTPSLILDSLRTPLQTLPVLERHGEARLIYLSAHEDTRRLRYRLAAETDPVKASISFDIAANHPTERMASSLAPMAHLAIETDGLAIGDVVDLVMQMLPTTG